jgi:hypothetical protein
MSTALVFLAAFALSGDGGTKVLNDETVVIPHGEPVVWSLPIGNLHVSVSGVKHADKGFEVVLRPGDRLEVANLAKRKTVVPVKQFSGDVEVKTTPFSLAIANTENLVERVSVHVHITQEEPAPK